MIIILNSTLIAKQIQTKNRSVLFDPIKVPLNARHPSEGCAQVVLIVPDSEHIWSLIPPDNKQSTHAGIVNNYVKSNSKLYVNDSAPALAHCLAQ